MLPRGFVLLSGLVLVPVPVGLDVCARLWSCPVLVVMSWCVCVCARPPRDPGQGTPARLELGVGVEGLGRPRPLDALLSAAGGEAGRIRPARPAGTTGTRTHAHTGKGGE